MAGAHDDAFYLTYEPPRPPADQPLPPRRNASAPDRYDDKYSSGFQTRALRFPKRAPLPHMAGTLRAGSRPQRCASRRGCRRCHIRKELVQALPY